MRKFGIVSLLVLTAALSLAGVSAAQERDGLSARDRQFIRGAAHSNMAEIMTSQLALTRASNDQVRQFAQKMITDHRRAQSALKQIAASHSGAVVPKDTDPPHKAVLRRLSRLSGARFDREYMTAQVRGHNATVAMFKRYLEKGQDSHVRDYAVQFLPPVEDHLKMAYQIAYSIGALRANAR
jgi:putative membrane protein